MTVKGNGEPVTDAKPNPVSDQTLSPTDAIAPRETERAKTPTLRTHRFTLVGKASSSLAAAPKKSAGCTSTVEIALTIKVGSSLAMAFFPLGSSNKCAVCHKRVGQRPSLQCDDCDSEISQLSRLTHFSNCPRQVLSCSRERLF